MSYGQRDQITDGKSGEGPTTMPIRVLNPITGESAWRDELKCGSICTCYASFAIWFGEGFEDRKPVLACRDCVGRIIDASTKFRPEESWTVKPVTTTTYPCGYGCDHKGWVRDCYEHGMF